MRHRDDDAPRAGAGGGKPKNRECAYESKDEVMDSKATAEMFPLNKRRGKDDRK